MIAFRALWLCHACHDDAADRALEDAAEQARTEHHPEPKDDEAAA